MHAEWLMRLTIELNREEERNLQYYSVKSVCVASIVQLKNIRLNLSM